MTLGNDKTNGDILTPEEWNAMATDQLTRLKNDGSVVWTGDQDSDGHTIKNLAAPSDNNDAVRKSDLDTHKNDMSNPHSVDKSDVGLGSVENISLSTWAGTENITTVGTLSSGNADAVVTDASTSAKGKVKLAIASEVDAGISTSVAVTPDALAGSIFGIRTVQIAVTAPDGAVGTGDGMAYFVIPPEMNGMDLVDADAAVVAVSSSGTPTVQIHNTTDSQDMLSTRITIDVGEYTSYTAETAPVIDGDHAAVETGDIIRIDVDEAGTGIKGLIVVMSFRLP